jgi:translation elongation factor aEF-1 beta
VGDVLLEFKITTEQQDRLYIIEEKIKNMDDAKLNSVKREPFVFGMQMIMASFIVPDKEGMIDALEAKLTAIKEVGNVENTKMTLI